MNTVMKDTEYFTLYQLADGVFAAIAKPGTGAWSNAGFVDLGDGLLVFDAFSTPSAAQELRKVAEEISGKKVVYLINSHYHGDHVFGNQVFSDCTIISTSVTHQLHKERNVMKDLRTEQKEMEVYLNGLNQQAEATTDGTLKEGLRNQYEEMSKVLDDLPQLQMVYPNLIFEDKLVLHGANRRVELYCYGGGHTPSDTLLYLPEDKIAFMGDIVTEALHLPIHDPEEFLLILNKVEKMEINQLVPGHGNVSTFASLHELKDYLTFLIDHAKQAHEQQHSLEHFISHIVTPPKFQKWRGVNGIVPNLKSVYQYFDKKCKNEPY
ncbi:glyoxylase-like metal-dependent hydrolase (beta-lactamase superfamily II) [Salirhabdus euzebyi]|uniref:Glyoxylase-like metal-dependent hydrolase (Beta-lactamase superfamily II) n=1 Tax=Salirhabdus euzebyi TaxID=394506 RepID=A0A841Q6R6_9BACI|nr:MBL fold metallo-hydrolase [Salirhabdus euzebyi]MBB6454017.1 glyoxylase-like metal-dependent hydrolase (beta-lactamase superfamily II) [Salirhabdus euzebyi]